MPALPGCPAWSRDVPSTHNKIFDNTPPAFEIPTLRTKAYFFHLQLLILSLQLLVYCIVNACPTFISHGAVTHKSFSSSLESFCLKVRHFHVGSWRSMSLRRIILGPPRYAAQGAAQRTDFVHAAFKLVYHFLEFMIFTVRREFLYGWLRINRRKKFLYPYRRELFEHIICSKAIHTDVQARQSLNKMTVCIK